MSFNLSRPQAVLFDLDGTLVDTADDLGAALNHVLAHVGKPLCEPQQYRPVASHGAKGLLELGFGADLVNYSFAELRQMFLQYYALHIADHSILFAGAETLLQQLGRADIPWGIVTNKPYKLAASLLRQLPALADCRILLGGDSLAQRKPDPTPLWVACHQLQVAPQHCWYLGDAERDIAAGRRAGMQTIVAGFGYLSQDDQPQLWQADCQIDHFSQLFPLLD